MVFHRPTGDCRSAAYDAAAGNPAHASENEATAAVKKMDALISDLLDLRLSENKLPPAVHVGALSCAAFYRGAVEPRLLRKIAAPQIQSEQRTGGGAHGMRLVAGMMNQRSRSMFAPHGVALLPSRGAAQRQVDFLGFVAVARIQGGRSQDQKAAREVFARQGTAPAEDLAPSVIIEKSGVEIARGVGLTPGQRRRGSDHRGRQIRGERRGVGGNVWKTAQHRQIGGVDRPRPGGGRPIREKWSERGLP